MHFREPGAEMVIYNEEDRYCPKAIQKRDLTRRRVKQLREGT